MTKTYAQKKRSKSFNWFDALKTADKLSTVGKNKLYAKSQSWVTCACGNQSELIPRYDSGAPHDWELHALGRSFSFQVRREEWKNAKSTLHRIEIRAGLIMQNTRIEILAERKQLLKEAKDLLEKANRYR